MSGGGKGTSSTLALSNAIQILLLLRLESSINVLQCWKIGTQDG
ncbi:putative PRONE domain-containing protein [Helianthus annuus]|uniref:PRONE domain-containing protein n=1 Tax=Helianthus annuus TaxID=4232 RepID=A0A9K3GWS5_HELAN|nr:putative PRONE domain-containing protein [Helianthus annuus]